MIGFLLGEASQVPSGNDWLSAAEQRWFNDRRSAKRVADWRLGRWTAKTAIGTFLEWRGRPLPQGIEILAADDGAPEVLASGTPLPLSLSISHSHGRALCAVAEESFVLGCDIELIETRSAAFVTSYFTAAECASWTAAGGSERDLLANLTWSAKESAFKALRHGLRVDTRSIEVTVSRPSGPGGWKPLRLTAAGDDTDLAGHWRQVDDFLLTLVSRPAPGGLVDLGRPAALADRVVQCCRGQVESAG